MTLKCAIHVLIVLLGSLSVNSKSPYKVCVPTEYQKDCEEMLEIPTKSKAALECVVARDRMECLSFIQQRQADLVPVDPEDMYVAAKMPNQDFVLFQEYRTDEEPDAKFRYEAVIVVHKDQEITNLDQLRGLKSCHTGINRNVGYKIPLTMLMRRQIFPKMNDPNFSPKENELRALSSFFGGSCIVGDWSPDPKTNTVWKSQYRKLCELCQHPDVCNYPDDFSGYEGALKCLAHNGGQVAFTKVIFVKKFFGLPHGNIPAVESAENPDDFAYVCVTDFATGAVVKAPIRGNSCSWAARPWQGLIGHNDILAQLTPLREKIKQLAEYGTTLSAKPNWFTKVLGLSDNIHHVADNVPIKPFEYLQRANYTEVIERGHGAPEPVVRLCVTSNVALAKCRAMAVFAFSRDIRPKLDCILEDSTTNCLKSVQDNGADLTSVDDIFVTTASRQYNLHPVFREVYGSKKLPKYAVAVVKKTTSYNNIEDLRGKRSCHNSYNSFSGLIAPLYYLVNKSLISSDNCVKTLGEFFSGGSCIPGIDKTENNPTGADVSLMTKLCVPEYTPQTCLSEGRGDVAFVSSSDLSKYDEATYELLCLNRENGGRDRLTNFDTCNIAMSPGRTWLSSKDFLADVSIAHTPLSLADLLSTQPDLFNIYGEFLKNNNVIFNNDATGLKTVDNTDFDHFKTINDVITHCNVL